MPENIFRVTLSNYSSTSQLELNNQEFNTSSARDIAELFRFIYRKYKQEELYANKMIDYVWAKGALSPDVALNSVAVNLKYTDTSYFRINEKYWVNRKSRSKNSFCRPKKYKKDQLTYY